MVPNLAQANSKQAYFSFANDIIFLKDKTWESVPLSSLIFQISGIWDTLIYNIHSINTVLQPNKIHLCQPIQGRETER